MAQFVVEGSSASEGGVIYGLKSNIIAMECDFNKNYAAQEGSVIILYSGIL